MKLSKHVRQIPVPAHRANALVSLGVAFHQLGEDKTSVEFLDLARELLKTQMSIDVENRKWWEDKLSQLRAAEQEIKSDGME